MSKSTKAAESPKINAARPLSELEDLLELFTIFDVEGKGYVLMKDIRSTLEELLEQSHSGRRAKIENLLSRCASAGYADEHTFTLGELTDFFTSQDPSDTRSEMKKIFDMFDTEKKGFISLADLQLVAIELNESLTNEELCEMIARSSSEEGKSKIYPSDFEAMMTKRIFS